MKSKVLAIFICCLFLISTSFADGTSMFSIPKNGSNNRVPYLSQNDRRWNLLEYGLSTFGSGGCCPTSLAMCFTYKLGEFVSPVDIGNVLKQHYPNPASYYSKGKGTYQNIIEEICVYYGFDCYEIGVSKLKENLLMGNPVIMNCHRFSVYDSAGRDITSTLSSEIVSSEFTSGGHFVVITGIDNNGYIYVNDPNIQHQNRSQRKYKITDFYSGKKIKNADGTYSIVGGKCNGTRFWAISGNGENVSLDYRYIDMASGGIFDWANFDLGKILIDTFTSWVSNVVLSITDFFLNLTDSIIFPERSLPVFSEVFDALYNISYCLTMSLILLMTLYNGFSIYILWKDGSPEENPFEIIIRYLCAIALVFCFKEIYYIAGSIVEDIIGHINSVLSIPHDTSSINVAEGIASFPVGAVCSIIFMIVYVVQLIKAMVSTMSKGIELFILRIGFPIACVDAVSPQASSFNSYVTSFVKAFFSVIVMKLLVSLSIAIFINNFNPLGLVWSIASLVMVNKGSHLLNQFIIPIQGGSGGMLGGAINNAGSSMLSKGLQGMAGKIPGVGNFLK